MLALNSWNTTIYFRKKMVNSNRLLQTKSEFPRKPTRPARQAEPPGTDQHQTVPGAHEKNPLVGARPWNSLKYRESAAGTPCTRTRETLLGRRHGRQSLPGLTNTKRCLEQPPINCLTNTGLGLALMKRTPAWEPGPGTHERILSWAAGPGTHDKDPIMGTRPWSS